MVYAFLADGRSEQEMHALELALAPSDEARQEVTDRHNAREMQRFMNQPGGMGGRPVPRRR